MQRTLSRIVSKHLSKMSRATSNTFCPISNQQNKLSEVNLAKLIHQVNAKLVDGRSFATYSTAKERVLDDLEEITQTNEYVEKYKDKIRAKIEKENITSVKSLIEMQKHRVPLDPAVEKMKRQIQEKSSVIQKTGATTSHANRRPYKPLNEILNVEKVASESAEFISALWKEYYSHKNCLSAVIPGNVYKTLMEQGKKYPTFILPVSREQGVEFYYLQFHGHQCYFTSLLEYQTHGDNAKPHLIMTHYVDFVKTKNIVLMVGELDKEAKTLGLSDALQLAFALQEFYVSGPPEKKQLLKTFHETPENFDYRKLAEVGARIG